MFGERGAQAKEEMRKRLLIWGGEGERDDSAGDDNVDDAADNTDDVDASDDTDGDDKDASDDKDDKDKTPSLEDQLDDEKRKRLKAERELAKREKAVKDAEADKDAVKDRDRYKSKLEARDKFLTENLLVMEINKQKKFDFIDIDDVIRAFKPDEVTIDLDADVPEVEGLDLALKRIAKAKPHFLKKTKEEEQEDDEPGVPSGSHPRGGKSTDAETESKRLGEKYRIPGYGTQMIRPV